MKQIFKDKKLMLTIGLCLLAVGATVGFLFWYDKKSKGEGEGEGTGAGTGSGTGTGTGEKKQVNYFPLTLGSRSEYVKKLQAKINEYVSYYYFKMPKKTPYQRLDEDGIFGAKTFANVQFIFGTSSVSEVMYNVFINSKPGDPVKDWILISEYSFLNF